jgi:alpha 1,6-mannosyltransferase
MLTFRRAVVVAVFLLTIFYFLHSSKHNSSPSSSSSSKSSTSASASSDGGRSSAHETSTSPHSNKPAKVLANEKHQIVIDTSKLSLEENLAYQFPYDLETKFPAFIWQTWKYTPASPEFGDLFRQAEASWTEKHPGFVHEVITDLVALHLMRYLYASVPEVLEAYEAMPLPILKADFFRYLILLARGGIYSDIDTHALKSAIDWIPGGVPHESVGLVLGIEADPDREDWEDWYSRRIQFCQWTIQAKAGHPVLREIVTHITRETLARKKTGTLTISDDKVVEFTGPAVWTDIIFDYFNDPKYFDMKGSTNNITWKDFTGMTAPKKVGDVVILPITSFSPGVQNMGSQDYDHPMAFVKHEFEGEFVLLFLASCFCSSFFFALRQKQDQTLLREAMLISF